MNQLWDFIVNFNSGKWVTFVKLLKDCISLMLFHVFLLFNFLHYLLEYFDFCSFLKKLCFFMLWGVSV
jgi:hypothetical protein